MNYTIRQIKESEYAVLDDFLYEAIFIPEGVTPPPRDIINQPELQVYVKDFGNLPDDHCLVAEVDGKIVGAVWVRIMDDYGHVDEHTPSFAISLYPEYRGFGIGTELMRQMLMLLKQRGYHRASLAVQKANYAVKMYRRVGFIIVDENEEEYIMTVDLTDWNGGSTMRHIGTKAFETARLLCRPFMQEDCTDMLKNWIANPNVQAEYGEPVYTTIQQVETLLNEYIKNYRKPDFYRWAIIEKKSGMNIGQIAFCRVYSDCRTAEIEYCIGEPFWGKGYATEALAGLIDYTFRRMDFQKLEAYHRAENTKSGRVLQKSAMHVTDTVERFAREGVSPHGEVCYCIESKPKNLSDLCLSK